MTKKVKPAERRLEIIYRDPFDLTPDPRNARTHSPEQIEQLQASIREFGFTNPVLMRPNGMIGAGHGRVEAAKAEKLALVPTCVVEGLTDDQWRAYVLADNRLALSAGWDEDLLREELAALTELEVDLSGLGFDDGELDRLFDQPAVAPSTPGSLAMRFGIPPFTILNAREGWWQDRKRAWIALGIKSEVGRGEGSTYGENTDQITEPGLNYYRDRQPGAKKPDAASFKSQDRLNAPQRTGDSRPKRRANAIPGGGGNAPRPGQKTEGP